MSAFRIVLFSCFILFLNQAQAARGIFKTGLSINGGYYDCLLNTAAPDFQHTNFGQYTTGGTLTLNFSEVLTFKNGASNICSANLNYRIYRTCDAPPAFTTLSLPFCCNYLATDCGGGLCGPDLGSAGDQKWKGTSGVNLLSGLSNPGVYVIELYYDATGDDIGGCSGVSFDSNFSNNYRAYFTLNMNDSFTDGNFTAAPVWSGDTGNFQVINNSNVSGLIGTEQTRTHTLKLNGPAVTQGEYLSTPVSTWDAQQDWYFWIGRDNAQAATSLNQIQFWLYANEANLESATVDGYRIAYGDDTGGDNVILQRMTNNVATNIIVSTGSVAGGTLDYGIAVYVTRSQLNVWTLRTSFLPQNGIQASASPTALSCVELLATDLQGSTTDATYTPGGTGYMGPIFLHTTGLGERTCAEFDNLRFVARPPDTEVKIVGLTTGTANEDVENTGNLLVEVQLANPSATFATSVDLVLTSGAAARAGWGTVINTDYPGPYTTITLTWATGASGIQNVYIDPEDNALCDDIANLVFTLQNATGGNAAFVGTPASYTATIVDDNTGYDQLITDTFEDGNDAGWTETGTAWNADTGAPITGLYSYRHGLQPSAGSSATAFPVDDICLAGVNTTWRFQVKYNTEPSANNNFQAFLAANEANCYSNTVDGYAIVVDQTSAPVVANDRVRLYRIVNGAYHTTPIINNVVYDWGNAPLTGNLVGFEATLNDAGTWEVKIDLDGGFDNLISLGTGTDLAGGALTYPEMKFFGMRLKYTAGSSDFFRFDDVSVSQKGCKELWYSQSTGNVNGSIWGSAPVSAPQVVVGGRFKRFRVQSGHAVTVNANWITNDLSIDLGGTLNAGSFTTKVFGKWVTDGLFNSQTSTIHFKGSSAQNVLGSVAATFNNVVIDNDGFNVTLLGNVSTKGLISPNEGTLQTGGNLTLLSTASASSSIGEIKAGAGVSGNITLQRYIPVNPYNTYGNWVNLGCAIQGQTLAQWDDDIITTGFTGSNYPPPYPFNNIRNYNESVAGVMNNGYVNAANTTDAISNTTGYSIWLNGAAQNIDNTGAFQQGPINQSLSYTTTAGGIFNDGWNLMTNAYPSEVDWNQLCSTFSVSNARVYYVFDHVTNAYKSYNASNGLGTASRYIPHSQSFMVKVNTITQNLTYQESYKTNNGIGFSRSQDENTPFVAMKLERDGMSDESLLSFNDQASNAFEDYDVFDFESPNENAVEFSLVSADEVYLAQDSRPLHENLSIPVRLDLPSAGTYTFSIEEVQNLPLGSCLFVEDLITGESISLEAGQELNIVVDAPYQGIRLIIHASAPVSALATNATCSGIANGSIEVTTPSGDWDITLNGALNTYTSIGSSTFEHLPAGTYELTVNSNEACNAGTQTIVISEPLPFAATVIETLPALCNQNENGQFEIQLTNASEYEFEVLNAMGNIVVPTQLSTNNQLILNQMASGLYTVQLHTQCASLQVDVDLTDPNAAQVEFVNSPSEVILEENGTAAVFTVSSNANQFSWFVDGVHVATNAKPTFTALYVNEGIHIVTVEANFGSCTTIAEHAVKVKKSIADAASVQQISVLQGENEIVFNLTEDAIATQATVEIFDGLGKLVNSFAVNAQIMNLNTTSLANGLYTIRISAKGIELFNKKIIK